MLPSIATHPSMAQATHPSLTSIPHFHASRLMRSPEITPATFSRASICRSRDVTVAPAANASKVFDEALWQLACDRSPALFEGESARAGREVAELGARGGGPRLTSPYSL